MFVVATVSAAAGPPQHADDVVEHAATREGANDRYGHATGDLVLAAPLTVTGPYSGPTTVGLRHRRRQPDVECLDHPCRRRG
ncbi:hypothetical protein [Catenuloplanes japonicus]|uniref:hypothetical protein n=1 Tax=Catenuloplanes japonicus TaxID=33876 RepID=UPI0012F96631|nr:hypothetical protein [Catenuloplanes japonicus]